MESRSHFEFLRGEDGGKGVHSSRSIFEFDSAHVVRAMNVYHLLIVVFSIAFVAPCLRFLYVNYYFSAIKWLMKLLIKAKRSLGRIAARKTKLESELEEIAAKYGVSPSDLRV